MFPSSKKQDVIDSSSLQRVFIVGAPKCGTTSMHNYLVQHPDICGSSPKEPNYFSDLISPYCKSIEEYESYYFSHWKGEPVLLESSTWNLACENAAKRIYDVYPDAKVIIMLREPSSMMFSLYCQLRLAGLETESSFETALNLEKDRYDRYLSTGDAKYLKLCYRYVSSYCQQIKRYQLTFPTENIKIILLDDLKNNVSEVYGDTLNFIGLKLGNNPDFELKNEKKKIKNEYVRSFLTAPPPFIRRLGRTLVPSRSIQHKIRQLLRMANLKFNTQPATDEKLCPKLRNKLVSQKKEEVSKLEVMLERDLKKWKC